MQGSGQFSWGSFSIELLGEIHRNTSRFVWACIWLGVVCSTGYPLQCSNRDAPFLKSFCGQLRSLAQPEFSMLRFNPCAMSRQGLAFRVLGVLGDCALIVVNFTA